MARLHFNKKIVTLAKKPKKCIPAGPEKLDPFGYFLIRIHGKNIEVGLCNYKQINVIKHIWTGSKPQDIYRQIICDMPKIGREHCAYLGKELARAWLCMHTHVKYIQDGRMDGTFPEADWLKKK